jgi:alkylation response protein AidB-like acyl-CoA dehydrogenase
MIPVPPPLPPETEQLRADVRAFCAAELAGTTGVERFDSWMGFDREFSRKLGARGWIGMTWPERYGGHERSALERYVVLEELLAAGAPVAAHWIADRQSGPLLLRYGSEEQKSAILPGIARGELTFCIGMSEPEVGSDLAAVRSRAERTDAGWRLNGAKIWTTFAHHAHYMIGLFRTAGTPAERQRGLSQFLIDLSLPGIEVRTIRDMAGREHFNEVVFRDAELPAEALIGTEGDGWTQVIAELALERSGPERYLSSFELLRAAVDAASPEDPVAAVELGRAFAEMVTLRQMSLGVATMLQRGENPATAAAIVKDLGVSFEQQVPQMVHDVLGPELSTSGPQLAQIQSRIIQTAPGFSLRGGTREILRSVIARDVQP